jgi:hypothetical protein
MFNPSNTTGVISATGTVNPSGAPCFSTVLLLFYLLASCEPNVGIVSGLFILHCAAGFLSRLFKHKNTKGDKKKS